MEPTLGNGFRIGWWSFLTVAVILSVIFLAFYFAAMMLIVLGIIGLVFEALFYGQRKHGWYDPDFPTTNQEDDLE